MLERFIQHVKTEAPGAEETPAAMRDRLKTCFPAGTARRMTLLGMMVGSTFPAENLEDGDAVVYASSFGESPAMEQFLGSFPTPSPTLFQTSIHPSAVQQTLIARARPLGEFLPLTGGAGLPLQAALATLLSPAERVWWCGGEERGSWLRENGAASERSFAFTLGLTRTRTAASIGRLAAESAEGTGALELPEWFDLLQRRERWSGPAAPGWRLQLEWL
jgi:hypothetical protein